jgi:GAF domain-containing protein
MASLPSEPNAPPETPDETIRRLTAELHEALEHQTATTEVLLTINSSPGDLAPVFDAMLEKAIRLCSGDRGALWTIDGDRGRLAAARGLSDEFIALLRERGESGTNWPVQQVIRGERLIEFPNTVESEFYRSGDRLATAAVAAGVRSLIWMALIREGVAVGAFAIGRSEVGPFSGKQIALLQNFAAQAVIAMENARLLTETREALEQQTATAEVLQVINSSPGELIPVYEAMLEKARILCGAAHGSLSLYDGEKLRAVAINTRSQELADWMRQGFSPSEFPHLKPLLDGGRFVQVPDLAEIGNTYGARTGLFVPLRKHDALLGLISAVRLEIRPFSDKEIALVENFAAQAVIAMENARLITETREALEQQTATAEVLQVINSSPGDLAPVFDVILEKAHTVCGAGLGALVLYDGEQLRAVATRGYPEEYAALARKGGPANLVTAFNQLQQGERLVHILDATALQSPAAITRAAVEIGGVRTSLTVPLRREGALLGYISAQRQEVRGFSNREVALLENFAAQAVIAMENARLLTETREALEQQTATRRGFAGHKLLARRPRPGLRRNVGKGDPGVRRRSRGIMYLRRRMLLAGGTPRLRRISQGRDPIAP